MEEWVQPGEPCRVEEEGHEPHNQMLHLSSQVSGRRSGNKTGKNGNKISKNGLKTEMN